ncbi:MAG: hypothetical protein QW057_07260 [Candidatus Bathyarchaeia archaeon]
MSGEGSVQATPSPPVEKEEPPSSEPEEKSKPEVRLETWKRWTRVVLDNLKEPKELRELYNAAVQEHVSQRRVDGILAVLEEAGLASVKDGRAYLSEKQDAIVAAVELEKLRRESADKETELSGLRSKLSELEREVARLRAGVRSAQCERLKPLDIEGYSGQRLFYCTVKKLTMGERAGICLACDDRVLAPSQPGGQS